MASIPYLFVDEEQVYSTREWYQALTKSRSLYERCLVKSITHVKNLDSIVSHEYLQIIVEDQDTSFRTRIIAERQTEQDQVIIGKWKASKWEPLSSGSNVSSPFSFGSSSSSSSSSSETHTVLPLPLASLKFENDVEFNIVDLAEILDTTTDKAPEYSIFRRRHCYWFAREVYELAKALSSYSREKEWQFSWLRWRLVLLKSNYKVTAEEFETECERNMQLEPTASEASSALRVFEAFISEIWGPEFKSFVGDEWNIYATEIAPSDITDFESVRRDFEKSVAEVCAGILSMPSYELGMETFVASQKEASEVSLAPSPMPDNLDILPSGSIVIGPSPEQQDLLDRALKASVGSIIFAMTPCVDAPCASMPPDLEDLDEDPESESYSELVVAKSWTWEPGHTIRIRFLDGSPEWQEKVETYARQWIAGANLKMDFVDETDTDPVDIRISFNRRKPTRSCIGTRSREVPQDKATMNFQFPAAEDFEGTVLHEFGHALGALHEHQSPAGGISWNKSFVYGYYGITNGWSQDRIDREIFYRYTDKKIREMKVQNSIFDAQSVMMYNITRGMTNDGFSVKRCQKLSPLDKHFIAVAYGPDKKPETDNVNALDENYGFPLYWAAAGGHLSEVTDLLTKRGADPNFRSLFDWTALHWAARNGHIAIVALLLFHGAKVDVLSDTRKTPLDLARVNGDRSIIEMLEMANRNQELAVVAA